MIELIYPRVGDGRHSAVRHPARGFSPCALGPCAAIALILLVCSVSAFAQIPRINTLYPIGGKAGSTVEVELRGSSLDGAQELLVTGKGVTGEVDPGGAKGDEKNKAIWQSKCGSCHELRSPANRSMTPAQWAATVERMVKVRNAPLSADEATKVTQYLVSLAKAGKVTAKLSIAPDAPPEVVEVREVSQRGVSTAALFEVGNLPEVTGVNGQMNQAQPVTLPCVANGCLQNNTERHFFRFNAKKGERLVFNLKAFRFNDQIQMFFNPELRLYDADAKQIAENHGYYDLDPLIDWTCPADGLYVLEVRDLLGRGNPGSVYRLTMGSLPYEKADQYAAKPASPKTAHSGSPLECVERPDNVTLRPGVETAVQVVLTRREGTQGDIELTAEGLPPGVTALPSVIPPDRNEGWLLLAAAPDAQPSAQPFQVIAVGHGKDGEVRARAIPQEFYRLNNDPRYVDREDSVVAVRGQPDFTVAFASQDPIQAHPKKGTPVKVVVTRRGEFKGPVTVRLTGLPSGWVANPETAPPDKSVVTLLVRPDGNNPNPFLNRDPKLTPTRAILEANSDEFIYAFGTALVVGKVDEDEKDKPR